MATDFNAILGNDLGCWFVWSTRQLGGEPYTTEYVTQLKESADSAEAGRKEVTAHSQGIVENSANQRLLFERRIKEGITKIATVYTFNKRFFFNQVLTRAQALDYLTANDWNGLLTHGSTEEMTSINGGELLIDAILGGT